MILARMSRKRSNAAGLPRNGYATAALVIAALRFAVITIALFLVILVPLLSGAGGSSSSNRSRTAAQAIAKDVVNAVESCAANRPDGTYGPCTRRPGALADVDADVSICRGTTMPAPGTACIAPIGQQGYVVRARASSGSATFVERHAPDGSLTKSCSGRPC